MNPITNLDEYRARRKAPGPLPDPPAPLEIGFRHDNGAIEGAVRRASIVWRAKLKEGAAELILADLARAIEEARDPT